MITNKGVQPERRRVQELADRYQAEGYDVLAEPSKEELPEFLRPFHPDLIALRPDRSVAVEVRAQDKIRRADYWREFASAVKSHPEWHLEVLIHAPQEDTGDSISQGEIENLLRRSAALTQQGEFNASLLLAWSAAEAAMRLVAEKYNVTSLNFGPEALTSRLFSEGLLDRQDYDFLVACLRQRNAVAHGFRQTVTADDLVHLQNVIQNLLTE